MCGIFGLAFTAGATLSADASLQLLRRLYCLSESRGKESAGFHLYVPGASQALTLKGAVPATQLLKSPEFSAMAASEFAGLFGSQGACAAAIVMAHSRLVTNGSAALPQNNQPVRVGSVTAVHNGIVVNVDELWRTHPELSRRAEVDTEVVAAILDHSMSVRHDPLSATSRAFAELRGAASVAWVDDRHASLTLATNTGDVFYSVSKRQDWLVFASERYILEQALTGAGVFSEWKPDVTALEPGFGLSWNVASGGRPRRFALTGVEPAPEEVAVARPQVRHRDVTTGAAMAPVVVSRQANESLLRYNEQRMRELRRCTKCVLPETFPFIEFDAAGVCGYCRSYRPKYRDMHPVETRKAFIESLQRYRRGDGRPDVIVPFSGGRDSSYGLHLIKKEFGLTPITFTYDWGMVTDLARRNIARICGALGIQNILVSADLAVKRENIRKNVAAWLKRPDLGLVPLFMAGDKHFFKVVNDLKRQTGIKLDLWCANPLENTDFKSGLCGIKPDFAKSRVDHLSLGRKIHLAAYYARAFALNPGYLNSSLRDTFGAFLAYYVEPRRDFYFIFNHFIWDERDVNRLLRSEYDWELSPDSPSSWRIGDGTAPFYNYIYMTSRGFTEFDTFRSNQIREGMIGRNEALEAILVENRPRTQSLRWYLETIGLDFNTVIPTINKLDTLGLHS